MNLRQGLSIAAGLIFVQCLARETHGQRTGASELLSRIREEHGLPALAAVVVKDGKVREAAAVGVRKSGESTPVTIQDKFHIGSCTKSMTATLAALLVERGKIRWDTTIAEVFPELKGKVDRLYLAVNLEQLLSHRGGCPNKPPNDAWARAWRKQGTPAEQRYEFIKSVLSKPPEAQPGTKYVYSNQGYAVAGAMLERVTGTAWEQLITQMLFRPLGMDSAGFGPPGKAGGLDQPWGHVLERGRAKPVQSDNPPAIGPAGTVHCSLLDLARYAIFHVREGFGRKELLKPQTFARLHTPVTGQDYAMGWLCAARERGACTALTHAGSNTMWFVVMWLVPKKEFAVLVGTNIAGPEAEKACDKVSSAMVKKWVGE